MYSHTRRVIILLLCASVFALIWLCYDGYRFLRTPLIASQQPFHYVFAPGMTTADLARDLQQHGVLSKPYHLIWLAKLSGLSTQLQAGEYHFQPGTGPRALLQQMARGDVVTHLLMLIEGWNFDQLMAEVRADPNITQKLQGLSAEEIMLQVAERAQHPEGLFFPDSYKFTAGMTDITLLRRAYRIMQKKLQQLWENRADDLPYNNAYEALIAASIIEKETGLDHERPVIASVLINRLRVDMRLQFDPTVIYGLGTAYTGRLVRSQLQQDTPYNTYMHHGLPPTPIAMPGEASLIAAMHPAQTDYFYFVAKGDGSHKFSTTLEQQNEAIKKYRSSA